MEKLWEFTDNLGSFESKSADKIKSLYFPLCNEALMSSITPDLHGDIKSGQDSFLLQPVSRIDLANLKSSRNFWVYINKDKIWSATGVSKDLKQIQNDKFSLVAGLLWQKVSRENKELGLRAEILSFVPAGNSPVEIMQVKITNISSKAIEFIPTAAIPIYARSANNLRDHRHVTSLLQRVSTYKTGVIVKPTLSFDEAGHHPNKEIYFVLGFDEKYSPPEFIYPTQEMFCGEGGDLEAPLCVLENKLPVKFMQIQGKESMGALRFPKIHLKAKESHCYIILMGISEEESKVDKVKIKFNTSSKVKAALEETKDYWSKISHQINISTGNPDFDNWFRWVNIQPLLRRIFGCSFLPDFDYGKGGRGWRDLWQDCLGLILNNPENVRGLLANNFSGVRIDGSNATIIGKKGAGFIADRNAIARVWMDHGVWPLLTLDLYINETGDFAILFEKTTYFRDQHILRSREVDKSWGERKGNKLKTFSGKVYAGSILEHLLIQNLIQFFNVGRHNHIRLEGGDWNDGLDMAKEYGESVAFSAMYGQNLKILSDLLLRMGRHPPQRVGGRPPRQYGGRKVEVACELKILLAGINYSNIKGKQKILSDYFIKTKSGVSGKKISIDTDTLSKNLKDKSEWMFNNIRKREWLGEGFFNGYYDNKNNRVEGRKNSIVRMMLASQVFPVMSGAADERQLNQVLKSVKKYLRDKKLKGYHLNTDFSRSVLKTPAGALNLGRAFSFVYGDKENGAFFNHMAVMFAYALYKRKLADEAWEVLSSIYNMAMDTAKSRIYPCIPEYFNLEGRGMYSYLTGSASWFVLTILTQAFGVSGKDGDLLIEPKLTGEQFKRSSTLIIERVFAGRRLQIKFFNPEKLGYARYKIIKASLNSRSLPLKYPDRIIIKRKILLGLTLTRTHTLVITLGSR